MTRFGSWMPPVNSIEWHGHGEELSFAGGVEDVVMTSGDAAAYWDQAGRLLLKNSSRSMEIKGLGLGGRTVLGHMDSRMLLKVEDGGRILAYSLRSTPLLN